MTDATHVASHESISENHTAVYYTIAVRTSAIAGVFALVVATLLIYDFSRRAAKDPSQSILRESLVENLKKQPTNDALLEAIRQLDLDLRREYFRQRAFSLSGALLLCGGIIVFLAASRWATTLQRRLPMPRSVPLDQDWETRWLPAARWSVGGLFAVLALVSIATIFWPTGAWQAVREHSSPVNAVASANPLNRPAGGAPTAVKPALHAPAEIASEDEMRLAWPCFRGAGGLGISEYTNVPDAWDGGTGTNISWKCAVPLPGNNSPIVWGNRVFLSGADETQRQVFCFDAMQGTLLWRRDVPSTPGSVKTIEVNSDTGFAASTMATDGRYVAAIFANGDLVCFAFDGTLVWSKSLGIPLNSYGHGASLTVYKNCLLVPFDQGEAVAKKSVLYAFDFATGQIVWQQSRNVERSWSTPIVVRAAGCDQVITTSNPWTIAYDAASGNELWRAKCLQGDVAPSPVFGDGIVYAQGDYRGPLVAIRPDGRGDVTSSHIVWKAHDNMPDICSPVAAATQIYVLTSEGTLTSYDAKNGDKLWEEEFDDFQTKSSPSLVGNRLYLIGQEGKGWILEPGPTACKRLGETDLGEKCTTSPAFQDGRIYFRGEMNLFCIGKPVARLPSEATSR